MDHLRPVARCPACGGGMVDLGVTALGELRCAACHGAFLDGPSTLQLGEYMGQEPATFRARLMRGSVPWLRAVTCIRCVDRPMRRVRLRTCDVDFCDACGGCWLDPGDLHALSAGQMDDPPPGDIRRRVLTAVLEEDINQVMPMAALLEPRRWWTPWAESARARVGSIMDRVRRQVEAWLRGGGPGPGPAGR